MKKKLLRLKAFTLIELLVVITIIGILASLAIPTIGAALDKANQTKDINNIKQTGTILFMDANDNNGNFNTNTTAKATYKQLFDDGVLTTLSVLAGTGQTPAKDSDSLTGGAGVAGQNMAWAYNTGLATSAQPGTILLISYGSTYTGDTTTNVTPKLDKASLWGNKGVLVYYVGGNAKFVKTKGTTAKTADILESKNVSAGTVNEP